MFTIILLLISLSLSEKWRNQTAELGAKKLELANEVPERRFHRPRLRHDLPVRVVKVPSRSDKRVGPQPGPNFSLSTVGKLL